MPVLVESDSAWANALSSALPSGTQVVGALGQLENWLAGSDEYAVVLGPNLDLGDALTVAEKLRHQYPTTGLVLLRHQLTAEIFQSAMRAGVPAVIAADDLEGLGAAVERNRQTWEAIRGPAKQAAEGKQGKVITVFSPKGGVGKTTVAVNLAVALANSGAARVCVVDLDLAFGDVAITLQLIPEHTIVEAVGTEEHLDFALLETLLTRHDSCSILAAPTHPEGKDRVTPALVSRVLRTLRSHFDYVVVDTAPSFDDQVLHAFDETDECVLVATLDVPTVKNMKVALETLDALELAVGRRLLLLNRADDEVGLSPANVESLLKMPVTTALPTALAVANATNHGRPIVLSRPDHPVSKDLVLLANKLASAAKAGASAKSTAGPADDGDKRGLFGRRKK